MKNITSLIHPVTGLTLVLLGATACGTYSGGATTDDYGNPVAKAPVANALVEKPARIGGPISAVDTDIGPVLGGGKEQRTLYTFDKDEGAVSNCYDACAAAWPPFLVADPAKATEFLTITGRTDGKMQWVFEGQPLYFWAGDTEKGQTTGANVPKWKVATP